VLVEFNVCPWLQPAAIKTIAAGVNSRAAQDSFTRYFIILQLHEFDCIDLRKVEDFLLDFLR
jgi:hypothetical protein